MFVFPNRSWRDFHIFNFKTPSIWVSVKAGTPPGTPGTHPEHPEPHPEHPEPYPEHPEPHPEHPESHPEHPEPHPEHAGIRAIWSNARVSL
jgi:hypothetical protein